ncbi:MAG: hypothetical protein ACK5LC_04750 [Coprobacillaceae bacterium]
MDENFMQDNLPLFMVVFVSVCFILLVLLIVSNRKQKAKKKSLLSSDPNLVEVTFDYPVVPKERMVMNPGQTEYVIYSVNGKPADVISRLILVPSGELVIDIQFYQKMGYSKFAKSLARSECTFEIEKGKQYQIFYDYTDGFQYKEMKE